MNGEAKILVKIYVSGGFPWSELKEELQRSFDAIKYKGVLKGYNSSVYHVYLADGENPMETLDRLQDWAACSVTPKKIEVISMEISV